MSDEGGTTRTTAKVAVDAAGASADASPDVPAAESASETASESAAESASETASESASPAIEFITPAGWPRGSGYAHGVLASGRILCVSGQIGWDPGTGVLASTDLAAQAAQALTNVAAVLRAAGASPTHVVRMTWYVTDRAAYVAARRAIGAAYRASFGRHYPAMAVVFVSALLEEGALVEIEATAVL